METKKLITSLSILAITVLLFSTALAETTETNEEIEKSIGKELIAYKPVKAGIGFIEKADDARHVRLVIAKALTVPIDESLIENIKEIKKNYTGIERKEKIKELLREYFSTVEKKEGYKGILVIGRGKEHKTYKLVSKEITNESASFYITEITMKPVIAKPRRLGFFHRLRRFFFRVRARAEETEGEETVNIIGNLTVERHRYSSIEIWKGKLNLEETNYAGEWDFTAFSAGHFYWPFLKA